MQLFISVYMVISTVATATALDAWADSVISTYIPLQQAPHLPKFSLQSSGFMYFKELCPCFPQNLDQNAKCPGVSQATKT